MSDGKISLASTKHRAFLQKLIDDDSVRAAYEQDPLGVAAEHGIGHDPANPPVPGPLPSKEKLRGMLDKAVQRMNESGGHPAIIQGVDPFDPFNNMNAH